MPKKSSSSSRNRAHLDNLMSDADSQASVESADAEEQAENNQGNLRTILDNLNEKRTSTRVKALRDFSKFLSINFCPDLVAECEETISECLLRSATKGSVEEVCLAVHAVSVVVVTLSTSGTHFYNTFMPALQQLWSNPPSKKVLAPVLSAMAVLTFVCGDNDIEMFKFFMSALRKLTTPQDDDEKLAEGFQGAGAAGDGDGGATNEDGEQTDGLSVEDEAAESCLQAYALMGTICPKPLLAGPAMAKHMHRLSTLLQDSSLEVRLAAGEAIALLYASQWELKQEAEDDPEAKVALDSLDVDDGELDVEDENEFLDEERVDQHDLCSILEELATDGDRHKARKERAVQRSLFRAISATVSEGEQPSETLRIAGQKRDFSGWRALIQLESFRRVLTDGFHKHFEENPLISEVFADQQSHERISRTDELENAKTQSKNRYEKLSKSRKNKAAFQYSD